MLSEEEIEALERRFPELAGIAFAQARAQALAAGLSVLATRDATLWEIFSDGTRKAIKAIAPPTRVVKGSTFKIR